MLAASTREVYLLLRARDEASRVVRGFGAELTRSAAAAQAAALRAEAVSDRQRAAQLRANGATQQQIAGVLAHARALDTQAKSIEISEKRTRQLAQSMTSVSSALETLGIGLAVAGGFTLAFAFESAKAWAEYQRQVALTRTQVDGFSASLGELSDIGLRVAREVPVAFESIQPSLFDIFSSTNANLKQGEILLQAFARAAVAGQTDIQTAARGTIAIMNAYNIPWENVNQVLDVQFELVRKGVGTYEEFAAVFGRVVPSATRAGQSFETIAAMLAFMTRNGQSAAMAAASAARAFEAMSHPSTVARLEQMGVKVRNAKGQFLPLVDVLDQVRDRLNKMPPADRVAALFELFKGSGGTIQARRFLEQVLLNPGELENFSDLLKSMGDASGVMEEKFSEMANTSAAKMQLLQNRWTALKLSIGEAATPALMIIVDVIGRVIEWFNKLDPSIKNIMTQMMVWGAVIAVVAGLVIGFIGFLVGLVAAFVVAGTEILIVSGAMAAIVAVLVAVGAAFVVLWKKSEKFRTGLKSLADSVKDLWASTQPVLDMFAAIFMEKVYPAIQRVVEFTGGALLVAFKAVGDVIRDVLIPVIASMVQWYHENEASVNRAVGVLAVLAEWVLKVGAVFLAIFVGVLAGSVVASILMFIGWVWMILTVWTAVVDGVIAAIDWLKEAWNTAWGAIKDFFIMIWEAISSFFVSVWSGITSFFVSAWNAIVAFIVGALAFLKGIWEAFWRVFGGLIKAVWDLIVAYIMLSMTAILMVVESFAYDLYRWWKFLWQLVWDILTAVWDAIGPYLAQAWGVISSLAKAVWNALASFFTSVWNTISSVARSVWNSISAFLSQTWGVIRSLASSAWNAFVNIISNAMNGTWNAIKSIWNSIRNWFAGQGKSLWSAGRNIIQGLIDGLTSKLNEVRDIIRKITQTIRDHLPFSPAKVGPLSGKGNPYNSGRAISNLVASGMLHNMDAVAMASAQVARKIDIQGNVETTFGSTANTGGVGSVGSQDPASKIVNNTYNIVTQEIDPVRHATELGFLLEGKM